MRKLMRAKLLVKQVMSFTDPDGIPNSEQVEFKAVCPNEFTENGESESENNSFSRWTPTADLTMCINNKDLLGKLKEGDEYYVDFTLAINEEVL